VHMVLQWNDEGETQWYTYYYWNLAQQAQWAKARPNQRFFTINRAFTPGMQRYPATTWTGDRQDCSHEVSEIPPKKIFDTATSIQLPFETPTAQSIQRNAVHSRCCCPRR